MSWAEKELPEKPRIYLAGPMVFYPEQDMQAIFDRMKAICTEYGLVGVPPIEGQEGLEGIPSGRPLYTKIVNNDLDLLDKCDGVIVCLDPFHGSVEMDAGTAVEVGYAHAKGKPMSGWTKETRTFGQRILEWCGGVVDAIVSNLVGATSGEQRDKDGMLIHSAELNQHGMVQMPIEMSGGQVFSDPNWEVAFRQAAENIAERARQQVKIRQHSFQHRFF